MVNNRITTFDDDSTFHVTANIIFNLTHLGILTTDTKYFDIEVYIKLIELETKVINRVEDTRYDTQIDIDLFLS